MLCNGMIGWFFRDKLRLFALISLFDNLIYQLKKMVDVP